MTGQTVIGRWVGATHSRSVVPEPPVAHVLRPRLLDRLDAAAAGPLTCISAPAGSGKTTLAADWIRCTGLRAAWLGINGGDDDPVGFWRRLADVLAALGVNTQGLTCSGDRQFRAELADLIAAEDRPVAVVVDGLDNIRNRGITIGLDEVLRNSGSTLRIVSLTRTEPNLLTARFRLEGRYTELRGRDLAFTVDETAQLLGAMSHPVSTSAAADLVTGTEGWVTGLRLFQAAAVPPDGAREPAKPAVAGARRWIADYLIREVLDAEPRAIREFMMRTSIARTLPVELAVVVGGRPDAETVLEDLVADNAFLECSNERVFRYHPLFAYALRRQLRRERPTEVEGLHRTAAELFAEGGLPVEALHHATRSQDWRLTARLIIDEVLLIPALSGMRVPKVLPAARSIPDHAMWRDERAAAIGAAVAAIAMDELRAGALLDRVDELTTGAPSPRIRLLTAATRLRMAMRRPDGARDAIRYAREALADLADARVRPTAGCDRAHGLLLAEQALALVSAGQLDRAVATAVAHDEFVGPQGDRREPLLDAVLAFTLSLRGDLSRAAEVAHHVLARTADDDTNHRVRGYCHLALAWIQSERAELSAAHEEALHAREHGMRQDALGATALVLIQRRLKDALPARHWPPAAYPEPGVSSAPGLSAMRAATMLAAGEAHCVERTLAPAGLRTLAEQMQLARARLALGEPVEVLDWLRATRALDTTAALSTVVDAHLVTARAADEAGDTVLAARLLGKALRLARRERIRRPFLEEGRWFRQAVVFLVDDPERYSWLGPAVLGTRTDPRASRGVPPLTQSLSDREQEVVRKLAEMLSTEEIAAEMFLSINTVKTHLRSIYRKLAASRRGEAVRRARDLGLL